MASAPPNSGAYGLRIALAFGDTILAEKMLPAGAKVTIGQAHGCTFVLPGRPGLNRRGREVLSDKKGIRMLDGLAGRMHLGGEAIPVAELRASGRDRVVLGPEDWGVLHLEEQPSVRLVVQRVRGEPLPAMPRDRRDQPLWMSTGVALLAFGLFMMIAYLNYDPERPYLDKPEVSDRMARFMFNQPPEPPPEEDPEVSDKDQEEEKERKKAGGEEGKFGDPNKRGPSNIPRNPNEALAERVNVGLVRELNEFQQNNQMADLLGVSGQVSSALGGLDDGALVVGEGSYGMSTKGSGRGGGGEGEGTIMGTGDVNVGGAGSANRKKTVKGTKGPKEKKVSVKTGKATVKGQLSKELIDREVRRHRAQITFCYNKQLVRFPNLKGKVVLRWIIAMDGSVRSPKVKSSSLGNKDAESCMVRALGGWRFPKPQGGVVQVDYPFFFGTK